VTTDVLAPLARRMTRKGQAIAWPFLFQLHPRS
jgi:hypothetical protein